jgi:hypothetical protein
MRRRHFALENVTIRTRVLQSACRSDRALRQSL